MGLFDIFRKKQKEEHESNYERVFCAWCQRWKTGHIVAHYGHEDDLGSWGVHTDKIKIHKHDKGNQKCKGSWKIVSHKSHHGSG